MPIKESMLSFFLLTKLMSGLIGPIIFFLYFFFNFLIVGMIIFVSSELEKKSIALCGLNPKIPTVGFFFNNILIKS